MIRKQFFSKNELEIYSNEDDLETIFFTKTNWKWFYFKN